jgi:hypothetical protein
MPLIEAALAFAITMLALSLICSSIVEIVHRTFKLRENGLEYMLEQLFDQVLVKYVEPLAEKKLAAAGDDIDKILAKEAILPKEKKAPARTRIQVAYQLVRDSFVERMIANRAPVGMKADLTLAADPVQGTTKPGLRPGNIWGGRRVTQLIPTDFMERLGSIDVGDAIRKAATDAGGNAADNIDVALKDIAQKFDGFGKDAASYFEGRARMMSVIVAIVVAFAAHVDAVDLFKTYLRDPNARAKVIEQSQAVTAQYKAAKDAADALKQIAPSDNAAPADVKAQVEQLKKDLKAAIGNVDATVTQYDDLGVPLGWTTDRVNAAKMWQLVWTCKNDKGESEGWSTLRAKCRDDAEGYKDGPKNTQYRDVWVQIPMSPGVWFYLFLGGLLIGLGSPFWYDAVTGLTNLRNAAGGQTGTTAAPQPTAAPTATDAAKAQPVTPVGAFRVSNDARALT